MSQHPTKWLPVAAFVVLGTNLLSPSISVSLWGSEPGLDGDSLYNTVIHVVLFMAIATHLKTETQLWRLIGVALISGLLVSLYGILQYYGLDPFEIHAGGARIVSSLGNPTHVGAFLLLMLPLSLVAALKPKTFSHRSASVPLSIATMSVLLLALVLTQARGPWIGFTTGLTVLMVIVFISLGWRSTLRGVIFLGESGAFFVALPESLLNISPFPLPVGHPKNYEAILV